MSRSPRVRHLLLVSAILILPPVPTAARGAAVGTPAQRPAGGVTAPSLPVRPCIDVEPCEPVMGAGAGMAVPLMRPWLRGTDGGWDQFTLCCTRVNPTRRGLVTGVLGNLPAVVVPSGGGQVSGTEVFGGGDATVVYGVSGRSYRLARFSSGVIRGRGFEPPTYRWAVSSDVYSWSCRQRAASRNPAADCGNGTHQYTRGEVTVPAPGDPGTYAVAVPIDYRARVVDSRGRPLANPYRSSTGHWLLRARAEYHGWLWTVEWTVGNVGIGRVAGSSFVSGSQITLTVGPFN